MIWSASAMIAIIIAARKRVIDEIVMVSLVTIASGFHIRCLIAYFMPHATLSSTPGIWWGRDPW
jgi:hypothetical protein